MSNIAIRVENLSKRYRIGLKEETNDTFVGAIGSVLKSPLQNLKRLQKLTHFKNGQQFSEDIIWALKEVSFEVKKGEVIGIIGGNGAGKSTLLKILAQITHPTSGKAELNGRVASLLEVGTGFHPELTGRENIYLNGTILGMAKKEIDFKLGEIVNFSGVEKFMDTPVKRYSSGMRVRLAFSVAAHLDPEILLIDEVLAVGDAEFQKKCLGKMDEVAKGGRTVLFVSHNMGAIKNISNKTILINNGQVMFEGDFDSALKLYQSKSFNSSGEVIWEGSIDDNHNENKYGFFNYLKVMDSKKKLKNKFSRNENIRIELSYTLMTQINNYFEISLILKDNRSETIFHSPIPQVYEKNSEYNLKGIYKACCEIEKGILNEGDYLIELEFVLGVNRILKVENVLLINIYDSEIDNGIRTIFRAGKQWPQSVIRPELNWKIGLKPD